MKQSDNGVEIAVPKSDRQKIDTIVALELNRPAMEIPPIAASTFSKSLTIGKKTRGSNVYQNDETFGADKAVDGDERTRWATDASTGPCWPEVDLGKPQTFDRAVIEECVEFGVRVKAFELQYKNDDCVGPPTFVVRSSRQNPLQFFELPCPSRSKEVRARRRLIRSNLRGDWLPPATTRS